MLFFFFECDVAVVFYFTIFMNLFVKPVSLSVSLSLYVLSFFLKPEQSAPGSSENSQVVTTKEENLNAPECNSENVRLT